MPKRLVSGSLKKCPQAHITSSPIARALQTAELIANQTKSFVSIDERLTEVWSEVEGQLMKDPNDWSEAYTRNREPFSDIKARSESILAETLKKNSNQILVTHGDTITLLYYLAAGKTANKSIWLNEDFIPKGGIVIINNKGKLISIESVST